MRSTPTIAILALLFFGACTGYDRELMGDPQPEPQAQVAQAEPDSIYVESNQDPRGVGMFEELNYYGQWHWLDPHGWVWRPSVVLGWQPFINGHWIWSQYGWMWVDYDPWGWATSHYGYWDTDFALGWVWIPDYTWSPAQCDWFWYDDTICWSPLPPSSVKFKDPWEDETTWVSVPVRRFKDPNVGHYRILPKYKDVQEAQDVSRTAPDVRVIERKGGAITPIEVGLDRRVVGEREFAKIKLPPDQESIVRRERTRIKTGTTSARFTPVPSPQTAPGTTKTPDDSVQKPKPETKAKSGSTDSKKESGTKTEKKYKDRNDDGKGDDKSKGKKG
jgi:hypothetical protein